jgi:hypothetical protein
MGLVDPHLLELGRSCPGISGGDADHASGVVADHKSKAATVIAPDGATVEVIEALFDGIDFGR